MRKSVVTIFILCFLSQAVFAQLVVVPIERTPHIKKNRISTRDSLASMSLPFWDDFSFDVTYPNDTLWQDGSTVSLNNGIGIDPPSIGVVTFDGLDSLGRPYDVNNALAKGFADRLESRGIRLDLVPVAARTTVYLSFFYEYEGNGEAPDLGDHLDLQFRNDQGAWEDVLSINTDTALNANEFHQLIVPVTGDRFFHAAFQFRFRNFGRLSGPYDTWNMDYIYLNSGRTATDTSFPDRTIATPMTSLFDEYWAIPKKHFLTDPAASLAYPSFSIYNLRIGNIQPLNYSYRADISTYINGVPSTNAVDLEDSTSVGNGLAGGERRTVTVASTLSPALFDPAADSFKIKLRIAMATKDNRPPSASGDYIAAIYAPIDFRSNDTIRTEFTLAKYYAYDDGTAEYGIGLNQPGAQLAYQFDMKTPTVDTVVAVDFYFPRFGDESNQIILFRILSDLSDNQQSVLYEENFAVERSQQDKFIRHQLTRNTVLVQQSFYMGWKQSAAVSIPIGWDKNTDSGSKIYFNTNGSWEQNLIEKGSMMLRPVFGKGGVVTGLPGENKSIEVFPNPTTGVFYLKGESNQISLIDLAGKPVQISKEVIDTQTRIEITYPTPGIYILKCYSDGAVVTQKIMVRQ